MRKTEVISNQTIFNVNGISFVINYRCRKPNFGIRMDSVPNTN